MSQSREVSPIDAFAKGLSLESKKFESLLPEHIPLKKFMRTAVSAAQNNPQILNCDRQSVYAAVQKAAQDGLILDGREAAITIFGKQATYMPMTNGILKTLRNSGQLSTISAETVHENDHFKYNPAVDEVPDHSPDWFGDRGKIIGVYAVAKLKDGGRVVEIMNLEQINKVRNVSRSANRGPWVDWFDEMARKTVLRRIAKRLPSSADMDQMFDHDNENFNLNREAETRPEPAQPVNTAGTKTRAESVLEGELADEPTTAHYTEAPEPAPYPTEEDVI